MSLWSYDHSSRVVVKFQSDGGWKRKSVTQKYITPPKLLCLASNRQLPEDLTKDVYSKDFLLKFSLPDDSAFTKTKEISYRPDPFMDMLRIQIDEGIKVKIYKKS